jgi:hypothetical protein
MSEFLGISRGIVEDFLQTAVFLDDRAMFPKEEIAFATITDPTTGETSEVTIPNTEGTTAHDLDAKTIIDTFMQKGIVCSVIKCEKLTFEEQRANYLKLMKKADIIVLDWDLFDDGGEKTVEIIKDLISTDEQLHELRSIVIYTANDLDVVQKRLGTEGLKFYEHVSENKPYTAISLWNKNSDMISGDRKANFTVVVDNCIDEFTKTFHGIVPNVAMAAIAEVRKNTHKLLGVLNKNLDSAYLSHRALLSIPEEAEKHLEEIIISEIESIVYENMVGSKSNYENIIKHDEVKTKTYQEKDFKECLKDGVERKLSTDEEKNTFKEDIKGNFTFKWFGNEDNSKKSENDFAILSSLSTSYTDKGKNLTLGVIVEEQNENKTKYLCIQPRCDSVRISAKTLFIFVKLQKKDDVGDLIVLNESGVYEKYVIKCRDRKLIEFKGNAISKTVKSEDGFFKDTSTVNYKYIATLKRSQAQRVANEFGAYISRVGLNESEYLRRNRP